MALKHILFLTCSIIWGLTWIAITFQLGHGDANVAIFYRFAFATFIIFMIALYKRESFRFTQRQHVFMMLQGLFMFCLNFQLTYWGTSMAPSALISLAFTALIFFNMLGAKLFLGHPLQRRVIAGAMISLLGMGFITWHELQGLDADRYPNSIWGFGLSLLGTISASAGNLFSSKNRSMSLPIFSSTAFSMLYGSAMVLAFCLVRGLSFEMQVDQNFVLSFIYLTIFGTVISFLSYLKLIEIVGPSKAAFTSVVSPVIALLVSTFFEDLIWSPTLAAGVLFCILGNIVALASNFGRWK